MQDDMTAVVLRLQSDMISYDMCSCRQVRYFLDTLLGPLHLSTVPEICRHTSL